jgi:hypothetical protein
MELKKNGMYEAVYLKDINKIMTFISEFDTNKTDKWFYARIVDDSNFYNSTYAFYSEDWFFYELSQKGSFEHNAGDLAIIQSLAVNLGCKDLFDKCRIDLMKLRYKAGVS